MTTSIPDRKPGRARVPAKATARAPRKPAADRPSLTVSRPELLIDGSDRQFRQLVHGLFSFLACHEEIRSGHAKTIGLAGIEYTVLISIAHLAQDGDVGVIDVAQHLHVSGAFVTTVCQRLQTLGLINKEADTRDRRRVSLTVSAEGRDRLAALAPVQRQVNDAEFACLSRDDFLALSRIVERLIESGERAVAFQRYLESGAGEPPEK